MARREYPKPVPAGGNLPVDPPETPEGTVEEKSVTTTDSQLFETALQILRLDAVVSGHLNRQALVALFLPRSVSNSGS